MPVLITFDVPMSRDVVEALGNEMGVRENPPEGLIVHVITEISGGGIHIVDIWESAADFERFRDSRLMPATTKVLADRGIDAPAEIPAPVVTPAHDLVRGR